MTDYETISTCPSRDSPKPIYAFLEITTGSMRSKDLTPISWNRKAARAALAARATADLHLTGTDRSCQSNASCKARRSSARSMESTVQNSARPFSSCRPLTSPCWPLIPVFAAPWITASAPGSTKRSSGRRASSPLRSWDTRNSPPAKTKAPATPNSRNFMPCWNAQACA